MSAARLPLIALLTANVVSICGTTMTFLAVPWFVLETTGSPVRTGLVLGVELTGVVASSMLGGPIVDRLGRKRSSVLSDGFAAVSVAAIPLLHYTVGLAFWQLLAAALLLGLSRAPGETARSAMMPTLVRRAGTSFERAAGAYDGVSRGARMLGAPAAGVLIAVLGPAGVLWVDAATFVVSAAIMVLLVPDSAPPEHRRGSYVDELRAGFAYLRSDRLIGAITVMVMATNMLDAAGSAVLIPLYAKEVLHSSVALGLITGVFAGGAVAGNALFGWLGSRLPRWSTYTFAFLLVGAPRWGLLALEPGLPVILAWFLIIGIACGAINPILTVVEFERLPEEQRARVFGVMQGGVLAAAPLGAMLGGVAVEAFGLTTTILIVGVGYLAVTVCPLLFPLWRQMDDRPVIPRTHASVGALSD